MISTLDRFWGCSIAGSRGVLNLSKNLRVLQHLEALLDQHAIYVDFGSALLQKQIFGGYYKIPKLKKTFGS